MHLPESPASDLPPFDAPGTTSPESRPGIAPPEAPSIRRLLKALDGGLALLASRGMRVPRRALLDGYARLLSAEALGLVDPWAEPLPEDDRTTPDRSRRAFRGHHARDPTGVRYWIVGRRPEEAMPDVVVPGIPDRAFDRILLVRFDVEYGVDFAGSAPAGPFLRAAEYREPANEWRLGSSHAFWRGSSMEDLTILFRITARRLEIEDTSEGPGPEVEAGRPVVPGAREPVVRRRRRSRKPTPDREGTESGTAH